MSNEEKYKLKELLMSDDITNQLLALELYKGLTTVSFNQFLVDELLDFKTQKNIGINNQVLMFCNLRIRFENSLNYPDYLLYLGMIYNYDFRFSNHFNTKTELLELLNNEFDIYKYVK